MKYKTVVAETRLELVFQGYEPCKLPFTLFCVIVGTRKN